jgi:ATP-dependent Clp protease protease subunit
MGTFLRILVSLNLLFVTACSTPSFADGKDTITLTADNTLVMDQEYTDVSVAKVALRAQELDAKLPPWKPIYLVMLSPGGSIEAGLELIDNLNAMGRTIHTVTIFSASMAFQNVQGLPGKRYITSTGTLMAHKARGGFKGEFPGQLDSRYQYYIRRLTKLDETTASRSRGYYTVKSFQDAYENELWCQGEDCVNQGLADAAVKVACDASLNGTKVVKEKLEFLGTPIEVKMTKAACPTITGVLDLEVKFGGNNVLTDDLDTLAKKFNLSPRQAAELVQVVVKKIEELNPSRPSRRNQ